jgi:hypothetical protein
VGQKGLAGFLSVSKRFKRRAAYLDSGSVWIERSPRGYEARFSVKAGTGAALEADHERKAAATCAPYFQILYGTDDAAELHDASDIKPLPEWRVLLLSRTMQRADLTLFSPKR